MRAHTENDRCHRMLQEIRCPSTGENLVKAAVEASHTKRPTKQGRQKYTL